MERRGQPERETSRTLSVVGVNKLGRLSLRYHRVGMPPIINDGLGNYMRVIEALRPNFTFRRGFDGRLETSEATVDDTDSNIDMDDNVEAEA
jgi:hypothetical protein